MKCIENKLSVLNADIGKLILRLTIGGLMLFHGWAKVVNGIGGIKAMVAKAGFPEFFAVVFNILCHHQISPKILS